jgi:hypothetical protein
MAAAATTAIEPSVKGMGIMTYGDGEFAITIPVESRVLLSFRTIQNMHENCDASNTEMVEGFYPFINDAVDSPINIIKDELVQFFVLFTMTQKLDDDKAIVALDEAKIPQETLKKYLILANVLDNDDYINILCRYAAFLIRENRFTFA